jgi:membrane protein DedA with SNARE-associated domain
MISDVDLSMAEVIQFLVRHGYAVLFLWVFAQQLGLPIPTAPLLLAAGALAGEGKLNLASAFFVAVAGSMVSDTLWYQFGRRRGSPIINLLCRISLDPDSCVRHTKDVFARHGARSLLVAKFLPGLNTAAAPLAGVLHMARFRFLLFDGLGVSFWVGAFVGLGYLFHNQIEDVANYVQRFGISVVVVAGGGLAAYIVWKYVRRRRFLRQLFTARITPEELKQKLDAGEDPLILDVRHALEFEVDPHIIPGAFRLSIEDLERELRKIPRDRDVILY